MSTGNVSGGGAGKSEFEKTKIDPEKALGKIKSKKVSEGRVWSSFSGKTAEKKSLSSTFKKGASKTKMTKEAASTLKGRVKQWAKNQKSKIQDAFQRKMGKTVSMDSKFNIYETAEGGGATIHPAVTEFNQERDKLKTEFQKEVGQLNTKTEAKFSKIDQTYQEARDLADELNRKSVVNKQKELKTPEKQKVFKDLAKSIVKERYVMTDPDKFHNPPTEEVNQVAKELEAKELDKHSNKARKLRNKTVKSAAKERDQAKKKATQDYKVTYKEIEAKYQGKLDEVSENLIKGLEGESSQTPPSSSDGQYVNFGEAVAGGPVSPEKQFLTRSDQVIERSKELLKETSPDIEEINALIGEITTLVTNTPNTTEGNLKKLELVTKFGFLQEKLKEPGATETAAQPGPLPAEGGPPPIVAPPEEWERQPEEMAKKPDIPQTNKNEEKIIDESFKLIKKADIEALPKKKTPKNVQKRMQELDETIKELEEYVKNAPSWAKENAKTKGNIGELNSQIGKLRYKMNTAGNFLRNIASSDTQGVLKSSDELLKRGQKRLEKTPIKSVEKTLVQVEQQLQTLKSYGETVQGIDSELVNSEIEKLEKFKTDFIEKRIIQEFGEVDSILESLEGLMQTLEEKQNALSELMKNLPEDKENAKAQLKEKAEELNDALKAIEEEMTKTLDEFLEKNPFLVLSPLNREFMRKRYPDESLVLYEKKFNALLTGINSMVDQAEKAKKVVGEASTKLENVYDSKKSHETLNEKAASSLKELSTNKAIQDLKNQELIPRCRTMAKKIQEVEQIENPEKALQKLEDLKVPDLLNKLPMPEFEKQRQEITKQFFASLEAIEKRLLPEEEVGISLKSEEELTELENEKKKKGKELTALLEQIPNEIRPGNYSQILDFQKNDGRIEGNKLENLLSHLRNQGENQLADQIEEKQVEVSTLSGEAASQKPLLEVVSSANEFFNKILTLENEKVEVNGEQKTLMEQMKDALPNDVYERFEAAYNALKEAQGEVFGTADNVNDQLNTYVNQPLAKMFEALTEYTALYKTVLAQTENKEFIKAFNSRGGLQFSGILSQGMQRGSRIKDLNDSAVKILDPNSVIATPLARKGKAAKLAMDVLNTNI